MTKAERIKWFKHHLQTDTIPEEFLDLLELETHFITPLTPTDTSQAVHLEPPQLPQQIETAIRLRNVGEMLHNARKIRKRTLESVAKGAGLSKSRISQLEHATGNLELSTITKVAHELGFTVKVSLESLQEPRTLETNL
jgi:DNA-binding phage protein